MIRISRPTLWALSSTAASALVTLSYLYFFDRFDLAAPFIQLYSVLGMVGGWMNAWVYYIAPRTIFLQSRRGALLLYFASQFLVLILVRMFFGRWLDGAEMLFSACGLLPVLYANAFGIEFSEGNYPWPYQRVLFFNGSLLLVTGLAAAVAPTRNSLFHFHGVLGLALFITWSLDDWNQIDVPAKKRESARAWLNPSVPVLERTVWDQWVLSQTGTLGWSLWVYLLGRIVTFSGNVIFSYLMGTNSPAFRRKAARWPFIMIGIAASILAMASLQNILFAFVLGQLVAWTATLSLATALSKDKGPYYGVLGAWAIDLLARVSILAGGGFQIGTYALASVITSMLMIGWLVYLHLGPRSSLVGTSTTPLPEGSLGIR